MSASVQLPYDSHRFTMIGLRTRSFGLLALASWCFIGHAKAQEVPTVAEHLRLPASDEGLAGAGPIRRYDWFHNVWNERRTTFANRTEADQGAVVFLGDSITQGWGDDFQNVFAPMKAANLGISGDTTRGMLLRLEQDVLARKPAAVVMLMGTNDLEEHAEPATIAGNVQLIIDRLKEHAPQLPIVWCNVFPSSAAKTRPADKIKELNRLVAQAVKGDSQVTIVDTWTLFANADGDAKVEEFPDLLHPNAAGYDKWKLALWPVLATLGFVDTAADDFQLEEGFVSLFNGHDLSGWQFRPTTDKMLKSRERWLSSDANAPAWPIVTEPITLEGNTATEDGRYVARHGRLIVTTPPEGRKIQQLWTTREFSGDFKLILEFRATPNADSGVFIREPQLQCRDFVLAGPYKELKNYGPQQWNELVVEVKGGVAHCTCNGEVLEEALAVPATGPIGLEGDRGQVEYRRIRLKQL
jgi:lysophospholipase L1-like esterase